MTITFTPATGLLASLDLLRVGLADSVAHVQLHRPDKRNAISDTMLQQLHTALINLPSSVRAAVLSGAGKHFCAGLDLTSLSESTVAEGVAHSRMWQGVMDTLQFGRFPIVSALDYGLTPEEFAIWFGILVLIVVEVGLITPPVGMNLFVINSMAKETPIYHTYRGVMPFVTTDVIRVGILTAFPAITLALMRLLY